MIQVTAWI